MARTSRVVAIVAATMVVWVVPPVGWALSLLVWILLAPLPRYVLTRIVLLGGSAMVAASAWLLLGGQISTGGLQIVATGLGACLALAAATGRTAVARWDLASGAVLLGASAVFVQQIWVERRSSAEQIISVLTATGSDHQSHFTLYANALLLGGEPWETTDGSGATFSGYPNGLYALTVALTRMFLDLPSVPERVDLLWPYVLTSAATAALAVVALGLVAVGVAGELSGEIVSSGAGVWAALALMLAAAVDSLVLPLANIGHTNLLLGAALSAALAWLCVRYATGSPVWAGAILLMQAYVSWATWPPLLSISVVPGLVLAWRASRGRLWTLAVAGLAVVGVAAALLVLLPQHFGAPLRTLAVASGGNAGFNLSMVAFGAVACVPIWLWSRHRLELTTRIYLAVGWVPLAVAAAGFGAVAHSVGVAWQWSYYTIKILNAVGLWFAPVLAAILGTVIAWGLASANRGLSGRVERGALALSVAALLVAGSDYFGPGASGLKPEMPRAYALGIAAARQGAASANVAGSVVGPALAVAAGQPEAIAVLADDPTLMHNRWLATLLSVPSNEADALYATTMGAADGAALQRSITDWIAAHPGTSVLPVCVAGDECRDGDSVSPGQP